MASGVFSWCSCLLRLRYSQDEIEQIQRSKKIDRMLKRDKRTIRRQIKLLLLGAGESGKSTFLKQMRIIHGHYFDVDCLNEYRFIIYQNIVKGMKVLVDARQKLHIEWGNADNSRYGRHLMSYEDKMLMDQRLFSEYAESVRHLWSDPSIRMAFDRRREFQLKFLEEKNQPENYVPSNQDILHARKATKGITEFLVSIHSVPFLFVDVGGQRSQRQKWFQCFENVTSILFFVSSSEFDQVLVEDRCTNRFLESLNIFDTIANNRCFSEISIILFLNKTDLLRDKLKRKDTNILRYFPTFQGDPHCLEDVQNFMIDMFDSVQRNNRKQFFYHYTTAIDTENIKTVFNDVRETILQKNMAQLMLQ
ncbi:guanine nucleotide-binding protein subunit alpha homolog [Centruroides sculpturatus]|uniref:guanine nucleotide-binding protein subunit alpha homolog n=1 Tax=Centruroides sculpturatus TaxID=218467 RepID=UPI000C6E94DF|nr:guanine nucleotide-binding protein subunit alpha homolog [Centruroides sculpturatus]